MKLKLVHSLPSVKLTGRVPGELHADLTAYSDYYREVLHEPIAAWPLVIQILRTFIDSDREFQAWRRRHRKGGAARPDVEPSEMRARG
jgi:hypothetical protein